MSRWVCTRCSVSNDRDSYVCTGCAMVRDTGSQPFPPDSGSVAGQPTQPPTEVRRRFNGLAIAAFVISFFVGSVVSLALAIGALRQIRRTGDRGRGLAWAAVVISVLWIAIIITAFMYDGVVRDGNGVVEAAGHESVLNLREGDCLGELFGDEEIYDVYLVPCDEPHVAVVFEVFDVDGDRFPGLTVLEDESLDRCSEGLLDWAETQPGDPNLDFTYLYPTADTWKFDDRAVVCIAVLLDELPLDSTVETEA